jgi:phage protein D
VFNGEITRRQGEGLAYGAERFEIEGRSFLHRLNHAPRRRSFEQKTYSQGIQAILDEYGFKGTVDSFGAQKAYWEIEERTDLALIRELAGMYGNEVYAFGKEVYVQKEIKAHTEEIIYEWGKSLTSFDSRVDIRSQISGVEYLGYDEERGEAIRERQGLGDITGIGGSTDWTKLSNGGGGKWEETRFSHAIHDRREAKELARGALLRRSWELARAEGKGEGNSKLFAGMRVQVKQAGELFSGEYAASAVIHRYSPQEGYTTQFNLKRNMLPDGLVRKVSEIDANRANEQSARKQAAGSETGSAGEAERTMKNPAASRRVSSLDRKFVIRAGAIPQFEYGKHHVHTIHC